MSGKVGSVRIRAILEELAARFPKAFVPPINDSKPRLLAIGIHETILAAWPEITRRALKRALAVYCGRHRYLAAFFVNAERIDLDGNVVATVGAEEFERVIALRATSKAARREARIAKEQAVVPSPPQSEPAHIVEPVRPKATLPRRQDARRPVVVEVKRRRVVGQVR